MIANKLVETTDSQRRSALGSLLNKYTNQRSALRRELKQQTAALPALKGLRGIVQPVFRNDPAVTARPARLGDIRMSALTAKDKSQHVFTGPIWERAKHHAEGRMFRGHPIAQLLNRVNLGKERKATPVRELYDYARKNIPGLKLPKDLSVIQTGRGGDAFFGLAENVAATGSHAMNLRMAPDSRPILLAHRVPFSKVHNALPHEIQHINDFWRALRHNRENRTLKTGPQSIVGWKRPVQVNNSISNPHDTLMNEFNANANPLRQMEHWLKFRKYPLDKAVMQQTLNGSMSGAPGTIPGLGTQVAGYFNAQAPFLQTADSSLKAMSPVDKMKELSKMRALRQQYDPAYFSEAFKNYRLWVDSKKKTAYCRPFRLTLLMPFTGLCLD